MSRMGQVVLAAGLGILAGCAGQQKERAGADQATRAGDTESAREQSDTGVEDPEADLPPEEGADTPLDESPSEPPPSEPPPSEPPPVDEPPADMAADPHSARAASEEGPAAEPDTLPAAGEEAPPPAPNPVFRVPPSSARPVPAGRRPALPAQAKLAVACVRGGEVVQVAEVVLDLDAQLARESVVSGVFALGAIAQSEIGLDELAARARLEGRGLLLVDVRAGDERTGYLLQVGRGVLLAKFEVTADGRLRPSAVNVGSGLDGAFLRRLSYAYKRVR